MTAPGNTTLLLVLLAVFVACTAYAAGRLHQWYRTGLDRDEAYRDGYDTATRSVFGLAARIIGPRRDKAAGQVSANTAPAARPAAPAPDESPGSGRRRRFQRNAAPVTAIDPPSFPAPVEPPARLTAPAPERIALPPLLDEQFALSGEQFVLSSPAGDQFALSAPSGEQVALPPLTGEQLALPPLLADVPVLDGSGAGGPVPHDDWSPAGEVTTVGIPAGWVRVTQAGPPAGPGRTTGEPVLLERIADPAEPSSGRHLVPDELVQAPTYRLTPDRVARAKVRDAATVTEGEVTTRLPAPRPRSS